MACFCKCGTSTKMGGAVLIMAAAVAASNGLVNTGQANAQQGEHPRSEHPQAKQERLTLDTILTRDMTYAASPTERNDAAWEKIQSQLGKSAPPLAVGEWQSLDSTMKGGTIESMRGEIVVIDFWGTWCPPCKAAMPKNSEMAEKYADKQVRVIGVANTRGSETMMETAEKHDGRFAMAADQEDKTRDAYGVQWWPYYVVVDRDGIVRAAGVSADKVSTVVDRLLVLQPPKDKMTKDEMPSRPRGR